MRYENPRPVYPNELYHHGIFGQHWGETNGPPYPLGSGTHNRVVRRGRAERKAAKVERKENKQAFRGARDDLLRTAYNLYYAKSAAKTAEKRSAKAESKAYKSEKHADKAGLKTATAKDERARADFWQKQYNNKLNTYRLAAAKAGKKAKYDESNFSIRRAAGKAVSGSGAAYGYRNALGGALGGALFGGINAAANAGRLSSHGRAVERDAGFRYHTNRDAYQQQKSSAKAAYKEQKTSGARHTGNSVSSDRTNAVNYLVRYGIPKATAQKVVSGKDKDSLADMMKDAYKNPQLLTMGANKLSAAQLERHLYG